MSTAATTGRYAPRGRGRKCPLLGELGHYDRVAAARASSKSSRVSRASTRGGSGHGRVRRAGRAVGRALHRPFTGAARGVRRATHAQGAGESGLGKLIELHAVNSAGDVLITVALASTVFFSVPTDEARGRVALYLAVTLAPFALLAPVIGPLLDRVPHGRRAAMAGAMLARALLAVTMSGAVTTGGWSCIRRRSVCWWRRRRTGWSAARWCRGCCRPGFRWSRPIRG